MIEIVADYLSVFPRGVARGLAKPLSLFIAEPERQDFIKKVKEKTSEAYILASKGVKFDYYEKKEDSGLSSDEYCNHAPSASFVDKALKALNPNPNHSFIDIGSGAGYAMYKASSKFKKVYGIEIDPRWNQIAEDNFRKLGLKNCTVFTSDINDIALEQIDDINVFYMYNPFQGQTMDLFSDKIEQSFIRHPRDVYIVYVNAVCQDCFDRRKSFIRYKKIAHKNWDTLIYKCKEA